MGGARSLCVRVEILPLGWRVFGCWTVRPEPRVGGVRIGGVRVVAGRVVLARVALQLGLFVGQMNGSPKP